MVRRTIPSLNWLRVFEAAARLESFARAATALNMSTSAVSQQIKALEGHFGKALFVRGPRHVELTEAGHTFLPVVRQALQSVEETANSLFGEDSGETLRLQCVLIFATAWLAPRLSDFSTRHPGVQLDLTGIYRDLDYQRSGAELQVLFGPVHRSWGQCDALFSERIYPVADAATARAIHTAQDLLQHRLIEVPAHQVNWHGLLQQAGLDAAPVRPLTFAHTTEIALSLAAGGNGIALARSPTTDWMTQRLGLVPCSADLALPGQESYFLVYRNLDSLSLAARTFRHWLIDACESTSVSDTIVNFPGN